jgi:hypothetical protein
MHTMPSFWGSQGLPYDGPGRDLADTRAHTGVARASDFEVILQTMGAVIAVMARQGIGHHMGGHTVRIRIAVAVATQGRRTGPTDHLIGRNLQTCGKEAYQ